MPHLVEIENPHQMNVRTAVEVEHVQVRNLNLEWKSRNFLIADSM